MKIKWDFIWLSIKVWFVLFVIALVISILLDLLFFGSPKWAYSITFSIYTSGYCNILALIGFIPAFYRNGLR